MNACELNRAFELFKAIVEFCDDVTVLLVVDEDHCAPVIEVKVAGQTVNISHSGVEVSTP